MGQPAWEPLQLVTHRLLTGSALGQEQRGLAVVLQMGGADGRWMGVLCLLVAGDTCGMSVLRLHAPGWHREHSQCLSSSHSCSPSCCGREPASWRKSRLFSPGAGRRNTLPCAFGRQQFRGRCEVMGSHPSTGAVTSVWAPQQLRSPDQAAVWLEGGSEPCPVHWQGREEQCTVAGQHRSFLTATVGHKGI